MAIERPGCHGSFGQPAAENSPTQGDGEPNVTRPKYLVREQSQTSHARAAFSILIVDVSGPTRQALAELLEELDSCVVYTAAGLQEMERVCKEMAAPPALALLEFRLCDGRGDRAAALLRASWPDLRIIYCVHLDMDEALRSALRAPQTAWLLKPTSVRAIEETIEMLWRTPPEN